MVGEDKRKSPRPFEPPPWERERFEELARRREAEEARCREEKAACEEEAERAREARAEALAAAKRFDQELGRRAAESGASKTAGLDDARADAMLLQLRHEDPATSKRWWLVGFWVGIGMAVFGGLMTVWAAVQTVRTQAGGLAAMFGSLTVLVFGLAFMGMAVWLIVRSRRRGES